MSRQMVSAKSTEAVLFAAIDAYKAALALDQEAQRLLYAAVSRRPPQHCFQFDRTQLGPSVFMSAFAIELFLKVIHQFDSGKFERTHSLRSLYDGLNSSRQSEIAFFFKVRQERSGENERGAALMMVAPGVKWTRSVVQVLDEADDLFVRSRYHFEIGGSVPGNMYLHSLLHAVGTSAINLDASFKEIVDARLKQPT